MAEILTEWWAIWILLVLDKAKWVRKAAFSAKKAGFGASGDFFSIFFIFRVPKIGGGGLKSGRTGRAKR